MSRQYMKQWSTQKMDLVIPTVLLPIVDVWTIFGRAPPSDNFWTEICLTSRTAGPLGQIFFSETGITNRYIGISPLAWCSRKSCNMPITYFKTSDVVNNEVLLISWPCEHDGKIVVGTLQFQIRYLSGWSCHASGLVAKLVTWPLFGR